MSIPPILATSLGQICMEKTIDEHGWSCSKEACIASCHGFESIFKSAAQKEKQLENWVWRKILHTKEGEVLNQ